MCIPSSGSTMSHSATVCGYICIIIVIDFIWVEKNIFFKPEIQTFVLTQNYFLSLLLR